MTEDMQDVGQAMPDQMMEPAAMQEKMLPQSQVNALIGREKAKYEQRLAAQMGMGGMAVDPNQIAEQASNRAYEMFQARMEEETQRQQQAQMEQEMRHVVEQYSNRLNEARGKYEDFDQVMSKIDIKDFPEIAMLVSRDPNGGEVLYELAKSPMKLGNVANLAKMSPRVAEAAIAEMADSIRRNEEAKQAHQKAADPLSKINPSTTGGAGSGGYDSLAALKKAPFLRG